MNALNDQLSLAPLGAGDLIDRAVRMYRHHFFTLIRIAAPPVLVSALGWMITTITFREINATGSEGLLALYVLLFLVGIVIIICGSLFSVIVIGGATRNLVAHLLSNEPILESAGRFVFGGALAGDGGGGRLHGRRHGLLVCSDRLFCTR